MYMYLLNTSFDFVNRRSAQLTAHPTGLASRHAIIHKKQLNRFSAFFQVLKQYVFLNILVYLNNRVELSCLRNTCIGDLPEKVISISNRNHKVCTLGKVYIVLKPAI